MNKEQIQRTIKLFRHRQVEANVEEIACKKSPASLFYAGKTKAYEFCADYLEANSSGEEIPVGIIEKIDKQIKENNYETTQKFGVSTEAGKRAGLKADAKLKKLFEDLNVNPAEYAQQKIEQIKLEPLEPLGVKKAGDLKIGDIIDNGSCGKNLGVVLIAKKRSAWMGDHHILLCSFPQKQEYVTWWADKQGETSQGHYFKSFVDAVKDYVCRGEKA